MSKKRCIISTRLADNWVFIIAREANMTSNGRSPMHRAESRL